MNNKQFKKKRIHEVNYAQKVLNSIQPDIQNIKLNQNLFHAQQVARHSSTLIKDIQKDVRQTLKKYDSQYKLSESNRKYTFTDSARKYQSEIPQPTQLSTEKELESLKQQQKILVTLLNNLQKQEQLILNQSTQRQEQQPQLQCIDKQWYQQKEKQLLDLKKKQVQISQPYKKKNDKADVIQLDISKLKKSPHNKSNTSQNFFSSRDKDIKLSSIPSLKQTKAYTKANQKHSVSPKKWEQYGVINKKNQQISSKSINKFEQHIYQNENNLHHSEKLKKGLEIKTETMNPRDYQYNKEFSNDLNDLIYLIDDLNEFNKKSKRFSIQK
ncbi:unnamed protein product [Paramecium sonneborni]|uniref:Uncharacterized protein n=1 Tax=Paramecium sonneborni TaxID=65129 RepID=A0A8S1Q4T0_9CILI|nr:unnamed protein product [Paramecium sonneborni]